MYPYLVESTEETYTYPEFQPVRTSFETVPGAFPRIENELSRKRVIIHSVLFLLTAVTATMTGANWELMGQSQPTSTIGSFVSIFTWLPVAVAHGDFAALTRGLTFAFTLLAILSAHEFGHYFACRYYRIRATLPFYVPAPPLPLTPFGTLGAVIKIKEPIRSRKALFDIGIAGPLAGFALALPVAFVGLAIAKAAPADVVATSGMQFNDPPLFIIIMKLLGTPKWIFWNPVYWAAWAAVLVTALNLFPVGQLDGGHVLYALVGPRLHKWTSRIVCAALGVLAIVAVWFYSSPIWILWTIVLLFLLRVGHPPTTIDEPLGKARIALAIIAGIVFVLCFMPFPITIS